MSFSLRVPGRQQFTGSRLLRGPRMAPTSSATVRNTVRVPVYNTARHPGQPDVPWRTKRLTLFVEL